MSQDNNKQTVITMIGTTGVGKTSSLIGTKKLDTVKTLVVDGVASVKEESSYFQAQENETDIRLSFKRWENADFLSLDDIRKMSVIDAVRKINSGYDLVIFDHIIPNQERWISTYLDFFNAKIVVFSIQSESDIANLHFFKDTAKVEGLDGLYFNAVKHIVANVSGIHMEAYSRSIVDIDVILGNSSTKLFLKTKEKACEFGEKSFSNMGKLKEFALHDSMLLPLLAAESNKVIQEIYLTKILPKLALDCELRENICLDCAEKDYDYDGMDTGTCNRCGKVNEVVNEFMYKAITGLAIEPSEWCKSSIPRICYIPNNENNKENKND